MDKEKQNEMREFIRYIKELLSIPNAYFFKDTTGKINIERGDFSNWLEGRRTLAQYKLELIDKNIEELKKILTDLRF